MNKGRKVIIFVIGGVAGLAILAFIAKFITDSPYRNKIPSLPDLQSLSVPLKEQLSSAYKKAFHNPTSDNLGTMGMVYHSSVYYDKAELCYKLAIKRNKKEWIWNYYLGYLNREMGETDAAIENYRSVIKQNPRIYLAWYYEGECYQKAGSLSNAELAFMNIVNRMDKNALVKTAKRYDYFPLVTYSKYHLARIFVDTKRIDLAEKTLIEIIGEQKAFGPAYRLLGNVYSIKNDTTLSKRYLLRANDLIVDPSPIDTLIDKFSLMSRSDMYLLKRIDEAEKSVFPEYALELVNHALTCIPENNYLIAKAIKLFLVRDMGKQALPYLPRHINYFQKDFDELKNVGDLLYQKGYYSQAMNYYSQAIKLRPSETKVQSCMVICLSKSGKKQQALDLINEILEKNNADPGFLADGVTLLLNLGEEEKAMTWLDRLKRLSPSNSKGQQLTGLLAEKRENWQEALIMYESAFKGDPADMTTIRLLGNLLIRQKMWDKAIIYFRKALEYHPNEPFLLEKLGTLLVSCPDFKLRNIAEGKDFCERAFINPTSRSLTLISAGRSLAIAYAELGDKRNACNIIKMTISQAQNENLPSSYLTDLKKLLQQFSISN